MACIFKLLKSQYPNFTFANGNANSWSEIPHDEVVSLLSLLMHHSCITDRSEVLTSPLCYQLSRATQLNIKMFLEKIDSVVTEPKLANVIKECIKQGCNSEIDTACHWVASGDSPLICGSPLQDFLLRTPQGKNCRLERYREIKQLQTKLELERLEKADLQEDLKLQCEKNSKLGR